MQRTHGSTPAHAPEVHIMFSIDANTSGQVTWDDVGIVAIIALIVALPYLGVVYRHPTNTLHHPEHGAISAPFSVR